MNWSFKPGVKIVTFVTLWASLVIHKSMVEIFKTQNFSTYAYSSTRPRNYHHSWKDHHENLHQIKLVEMPALGSINGRYQDLQIINQSLASINDPLHGICILLQTNNLILSELKCLDDLFLRLPCSALNKLCFCFMNTGPTNFRPGTSKMVLQAYLNYLKKDKKIEIQLDRDNCFCFENESFMMFDDKNLNSCGNFNKFLYFWKKSRKESDRLFEYIIA